MTPTEQMMDLYNSYMVPEKVCVRNFPRDIFIGKAKELIKEHGEIPASVYLLNEIRYGPTIINYK